MVRRVVCLGFTLLFLTAAAVQWNDPDPLAWVVTYVLAAGISAGAAFGRLVPALALVVGLGALGWAASIPEWNEVEREIVGLTVIGCWLVFGLALPAARGGSGRGDAA